MITPRHLRRGQALLMVTLAMFAMGGLMGLAVDLGWSYFVKKSAQGAADAAALAAAYQALAQVGETTPFTSSNSTVQATVAPCDLGGNLHVGCQYAQQDGFSHGGNGGRQDVTMISNVNSIPPTVPNVTADYWVTVRAVETIPQLFSTMLGNANGIASARATAAIIPVVVNGSVITLNRAGDPPPNGKKASQGNNIQMGGGDQIIAPQGVVIASDASNAGTHNGNASVCGDSTCSAPVRVSVLTPGDATPICPSPCTTQDFSDGPKFQDPMAGLGQPPLPLSALPTFAVQNGTFSNGVFQLNPGTNTLGNTVPLSALPSGNYVSVTCGSGKKSGGCATGDTANFSSTQLTVDTNVSFSGGGSFGNYFLYGGLNLSSSTLNLGGGELVMVGGGTGGGNGDLNTNNRAFLDGGTGAGDLMILTGSSSSFTMNGARTAVTGNSNNDLYPGLSTQINSNPLLVTAAAGGSLAFGPASLLSGADQASAAMKGLDPTQVPSSPGYDLTPFGGVVFWQDQANSAVRYTTPTDTPGSLKGSGYIDSYNCGLGHNINNPCTNTLANPNSPAMTFQANPTLGLTGIFYQPRGAWLSTQGGPGAGIQGAIQIITGAILMQGHGTISTTPPPIPLKRRIAALIE